MDHGSGVAQALADPFETWLVRLRFRSRCAFPRHRCGQFGQAPPVQVKRDGLKLTVLHASAAERAAHEARLADMAKGNGGKCLWQESKEGEA